MTSREILKNEYTKKIKTSVGLLSISERDLCDHFKVTDNKISAIKYVRQSSPQEGNFFDGYKSLLGLKEAKEITERILQKYNLWHPKKDIKGII